jgi:hypothetical protein
MRDRTPTLEQRMEHLAALDTSLNKSQLTSASNANTNTNASARKIESKKGGTMGTTDTAKDDGLTCYNCGQAGHISRNSLNCDIMKKLLKQALVSKDVMKAKYGCLCMDRKKSGAPTGQKESGQLVKEKQVKQEMHSEAESELENLSDSDSEVGKFKDSQ